MNGIGSLLGALLCPVTRQRLVLTDDGKWLVTPDSARRYPVLNGKIPVILRDPELAAQYAADSREMTQEYAPSALADKRTLWRRFKKALSHEYPSPGYRTAFARVFPEVTRDVVYLAVGGGPSRKHPRHVNLNIGPFPNVDIVADAHELPNTDCSVDAVYCEAVLEHLQRPSDCVAEMFRVLRPGGRVFAASPFMQPYHGYPHHYQNFTISGHRFLFERAGFTVEEIGVHVGPVFTIVNLVHAFLRTYVPGGRALAFAWGAIGAALRPLDLLLHDHPNAHELAANTYLVAQRPTA